MESTFTEEIDTKDTLAGPHTPGLWRKTKTFQVYASDIIPVFQPPAVTDLVQRAWAGVLGAEDRAGALAGAAVSRMAMMQKEMVAPGKSAEVILEGHVLRTQLGGASSAIAQLEYLRDIVKAHPGVQVRIIPASRPRSFVPPTSFMIFDRRLVTIDLPHAAVSTDDMEQVNLVYPAIWAILDELALSADKTLRYLYAAIDHHRGA